MDQIEEIDNSIMEVFSLLGKKWMLLILKSISDGCVCFSEIEKSVFNINPRILSNRLKELEEFGLIEGNLRDGTKNKVVYCLSEKGRYFKKIIENIEKWSVNWHEK